LAAAYWLLQDRRFALNYEPYNSKKKRGPDYAVTFKSLAFNIEVTRIGVRNVARPAPDPPDEAPSALQQTNSRLTDSVCDKLGRMRPGDRVLLVDEWIETGAQIQAAIHLIEQEGGVVAGIATINMDDNPPPARLRQQYSCQARWQLRFIIARAYLC
jgi:hypothetical protein